MLNSQNQSEQAPRVTDPKHSQCVIKECIAKGDAGQNLIPFQIALEERTVTHLCEEIENLTERPKDQ
jgi:hypothetical protein